MNVLSTTRLHLRQARREDAPFILRLLNEPSWLKFIGDRGVRTLEEARTYVAEKFIAVYERLGFGFYIVERKEIAGAIGICGLVKRDGLDDPDLGFAFLPEFWGRGYALEAAAAVVDYARETLHLTRLAAISASGNDSAGHLLHKLGFSFERMITPPSIVKEIRLFVRDPL